MVHGPSSEKKMIKKSERYSYVGGTRYMDNGTRNYEVAGYRLPSVTTILGRTKDDTFLSPTMRLLPYQLDYVSGYNSIFVSMQDLSRRPAIQRFSVKMKRHTSLEWELAPGMMLTCEQDWGKNCWQSVIYSGDKPNLPEITIDEWKQKYGRTVFN